MPVYTYQCENCGVRFERYQKFTDQPLAWCPECNKKSLRKVYSPVGIVFKGSGFYSTDNRSPSGAPHAGSKASEKANDEKSDNAKSASEKHDSPKPESTKSSSESKPAESSTPAPSVKSDQ
jgi:putative FmdB family regulatory protein